MQYGWLWKGLYKLTGGNSDIHLPLPSLLTSTFSCLPSLPNPYIPFFHVNFFNSFFLILAFPFSTLPILSQPPPPYFAFISSFLLLFSFPRLELFFVFLSLYNVPSTYILGLGFLYNMHIHYTGLFLVRPGIIFCSHALYGDKT